MGMNTYPAYYWDNRGQPAAGIHTMKVLLMHRGDGHAGGGQIQMNRLREGLVTSGIEARILCRDATQKDSVPMPSRPHVEKFLRRITRRVGLHDIHLISSLDVPRMPEFKSADLIDIHCTHSATLSYLALPLITAHKPTVFTFHDMWPITGHCHASLDCEKWKTGCGKCPYPLTEPAIRRDSTAIEWRLKNRAYHRSKFTIVTPSKWLRDAVRHSMLNTFDVRHIPQGIDTDVYQPVDKALARSLLNLPLDKKILIFGAETMKRPLKGADLLVLALQRLPDSLKQQLVLLVFGNASEEIVNEIGIPSIQLGYLRNDRMKVLAFSAADLFIHPSRAENSPLVILESMACGTPVASFAVGGVPELVREGITGKLAKPEHACDFSRVIEEMISHPESLNAMGQNCREIVVKEYPISLQTKRTIDLYHRLIAEHRDANLHHALRPSTTAIH
jgi:glycosyltransferase involved in cell wall biosynthesis